MASGLFRAGDRVCLQFDDRIVGCNVLATGPSAWILLRSDAGDLYLDVAFNRSAVSWSRVVLLHPDVDPTRHFEIDQIAGCLAWHPDRQSVTDVPKALAMLPVNARLDRA